MESSSQFPILWLVLAFVVVTFVLRSARSKGVIGELKVQAVAGLRLDGRSYRSFHNLTLPTRDGTTQIDHVIVSKFGVFVIETKNLKGWIFGDENSKKWTQSIYGKNYQFQNPLRQNYRHLKAVENLLRLDPRCLHSVVVFVGSGKFKTAMPPNVVERRRLISHLRSKTDILLSDEEVDDSVRTLKTSQVSAFGTRRKHIQTLKENCRNPTCPRCGKAMALRTAKQGPNAGGQFWGCSGFPGCRATKDIA